MNNFNLRLVAGLSILFATTALPLAAAHAESPSTTKPAEQTHRLGQHPAVLVKALSQGIDPNRFIVQPPASVTWRVSPEADLRWASPMAPTPADTLSNTPTNSADTSIASQGS